MSIVELSLVNTGHVIVNNSIIRQVQPSAFLWPEFGFDFDLKLPLCLLGDKLELSH